jgi:aldose 1-epimerase
LPPPASSSPSAPAAAHLRTFRGRPAVTLAAGEVDATFLPGCGALGVSLRHRGQEHLSLHGGLDAFVGGHTTGLPLLAPWANRLGAQRYRSGRTWVDLADQPGLHRDPRGLPMHGTMVGPWPWQVTRIEAGGASATLGLRFRYGDHPDLLAAFPFPHDLEVEATVTADGLAVATTVRATGRRGVPVSFGWHPYYRLPGVRRGDLAVELPARHRLVLDERQIPTGAEVREVAATVPLAGGRTFDDGYRLGRTRWLALVGGGRRLSVELDRSYPYAQVYAPRGKAFVALEAMTAATDALVTGDHPVVGPGEAFTATFRVAFG